MTQVNIIEIILPPVFGALVFYNVSRYDRKLEFHEIDLWYIGLFAFLFSFSILGHLVRMARCLKSDCLQSFFIWSFGITFSIVYPTWCIFGFVWFLRSSINKDKRHSATVIAFGYVLQTFGMVTLIVVLLATLFTLIETYRNKSQSQALEKRLLSIYRKPEKCSRDDLEEFVKKQKTLIASSKFLKIEKEIVKREFTSQSFGNGEKDLCSICLCGFEVGDEVSIVGCTHPYHFQCLLAWLLIKPRCPLCQYPFREALLQRAIESNN